MFDYKILKKKLIESNYFDDDWYCRKYPDVTRLEMPAIEHYLKYGWILGRDPGPEFSTSEYLKNYPDVERDKINPLYHYLIKGIAEGRKINKSKLVEQKTYNKNIILKNEIGLMDLARKSFDNSFINDVNIKIFVGIASIPQRADVLKKTIESLESQVDQIGIFLDKYTEVPDYILNNDKIVYKLSSDFDKEIGDAGKFYWVDEFKGFYFTCDDDLIYPEDYIKRIKEKINNYKVPVVIGWHGSIILQPFENYYSVSSRRVFTFGAPRPYDTPVHVLGTGCLGFHTNHINVSFHDFKTPNMADVYFAVLGQKQQVPFIVIEHKKDEIVEAVDSQEYSIYKHSSNGVIGSKHNTKERQNEIVSSTFWNKYYVNRFLKILVIGRFDINIKGGVYKSSHLLAKTLKKLGHQVDTICLSKLNDVNLSGAYDFCIAYAPDPDRPDFGECIEVVEKLANRGCVCAVNFSFNLNEERTGWISDRLVSLNSEFKDPRIFFASFSNSTQYMFKKELRKFIVSFPKTISIDRSENKPFEEREGIFLGDLAKLGNKNLVKGNIAKWVEQIRIKLPHVNIYALKHYHTVDIPLNYLKILPYDKNIGELLNSFRVSVCLVPGATFEMVPVESLISGTPVVHREMPQSLSEYLSPVSIEASSPNELGDICKNIYERKEVWDKLNKAAYSSKEYYSFDNLVAALDISIRKTLSRANIK